nr:right-handed parallel beta-helix repeat-containing protein [Methylosinus sp. Sm6]
MPPEIDFERDRRADPARMNAAMRYLFDNLQSLKALQTVVDGFVAQGIVAIAETLPAKLDQWFTTNLGVGVRDALFTEAQRRDGVVLYSDFFFTSQGIDVRLWPGVVFDGVTPIASALQRVEDYASSIGANLVLPSGVGMLEEMIVKRVGVRWIGQGRDKTILMHYPGPAHHLVGPPDPTTSVSHIGFEKICFDGNRNQIIGDGVSALHLERDGDPGNSFPAVDLIVRDCEIRNWSGNGFGLVSTGYRNVEVSGTYIHDGGGAVSLRHCLYVRRCKLAIVKHNHMFPLGAAGGIKVQGVEERAIIEGNFVTGGGIGIALQDGYDDRIIGNSIVLASSYAIKISVEEESQTKFVVVDANTMSDCTTGIWASNANGLIVGDTNIRDCRIGMRLRACRARISNTRMEVTSASSGDVTFLLFPSGGTTDQQITFSDLEIRNSRSSRDGVTIAVNAGTLDDADRIRFDGIDVYGQFAATWINLYPPSERPSEGSFTPSLVGGDVAGAATYSVRSGRYQLVGNRASIELSLTWSGHSGSGGCRVTGLPLYASVVIAAYPVAIYWRDFSVAAGAQLMAYVDGGEASIRLRLVAASGKPTDLALPASGSLFLSGSYLIHGGAQPAQQAVVTLSPDEVSGPIIELAATPPDGFAWVSVHEGDSDHLITSDAAGVHHIYARVPS